MLLLLTVEEQPRYVNTLPKRLILVAPDREQTYVGRHILEGE